MFHSLAPLTPFPAQLLYSYFFSPLLPFFVLFFARVREEVALYAGMRKEERQLGFRQAKMEALCPYHGTICFNTGIQGFRRRPNVYILWARMTSNAEACFDFKYFLQKKKKKQKNMSWPLSAYVHSEMVMIHSEVALLDWRLVASCCGGNHFST